MSDKKKKFSLIKFGVSEIKRKNLKQTYTLYTDWIIKQSMPINKNKYEIFDEWKKQNIYEEQKKEKNIGREISFLYNNGFILDLDNLETCNKNISFKPSEISCKWSTNEETLFYLKNIDYSFFQFLLKQKYWENNKKKSAFVHIIKYLLINEKLTPDIIISDNYIKFIKQIIFSKNKASIMTLIKYNSGSPNNKDYMDKKRNKNDELRDDIVESYVEYYFEKNIKESDLINKIIEYFKIIQNTQTKKANISSGLLELVFNKKEGDNLKLYKINNLVKWTYQQIKNKIYIKNDDNFLERVKNRIIMGSYSDYKNLIVNHINCLSSLFDINDKLIFTVRNNKIKKFLFELIEKEDIILELKSEQFYTKKELISKLNIMIDENNDWKDVNRRNDNRINECYTFSKMKQIINSISKSVLITGNGYNNKKVQDIIKNDEHVRGQVNWPTYYEFIVGIIFLKKIYGECSKNWREKMEKHLRLTIDGSLCPIRFASGGRSDILFWDKNKVYTIEPTTQLFRQTKHEYESILDHLDKEIKNSSINKCEGFSIVVAPKIEERFKETMSNNQTKNIKLLCFDNASLIKILDSIHSKSCVWNLDFLSSLVAHDFIKLNSS